MNYDIVSPYIRRTMYSVCKYPHKMKLRIILDYELIFIDKGCCKITVDGVPYECYKNDIIFLRPGVEHSLESLDENDFSQPHVHFDLQYDEYSEKRYVCFKKFKDLSEPDKCLVSKDIVDLDIPTVIKLKDPEYFKAQLFELIESFGEAENISKLRSKSILMQMLLIIFEKYDKSYSKSSDTTGEMAMIKAYIKSNCAQQITLDSLAAQFYLSKFYIEVNFKKFFGVPVIKYYNQCRLHSAMKLLRKGIRVGEVSQRLSFDNIYSFSRFFKNATNMSPTEYRKTQEEK